MRVIISFILVELVKKISVWGVYFGSKFLTITGILPADAEMSMSEARIYGDYVGWAILFGAIAVWIYNCIANPDFKPPEFLAAKNNR